MASGINTSSSLGGQSAKVGEMWGGGVPLPTVGAVWKGGSACPLPTAPPLSTNFVVL